MTGHETMLPFVEIPGRLTTGSGQSRLPITSRKVSLHVI